MSLAVPHKPESPMQKWLFHNDVNDDASMPREKTPRPYPSYSPVYSSCPPPFLQPIATILVNSFCQFFGRNKWFFRGVWLKFDTTMIAGLSWKTREVGRRGETDGAGALCSSFFCWFPDWAAICIIISCSAARMKDLCDLLWPQNSTAQSRFHFFPL